MKTTLNRCAWGLSICLFFITTYPNIAHPQGPDEGCKSSVPDGKAYRIYYHNSGEYDYAEQDYDLDVPEYKAYLAALGGYTGLPVGRAVIADFFGRCDDEADEPHGWRIDRYYKLLKVGDYRDTFPAEGPLHETISAIAATYGRGTAVNIASGYLDADNPMDTQAVEEAIANDVLLVVVAYVVDLAAKNAPYVAHVLQCLRLNAEGGFVTGEGNLIAQENTARVSLPTNWYNESIPAPDQRYLIADAGLSDGYHDAWRESNSYSTPLLMAVAKHVADVVAGRDGYSIPAGEFVERVIDYVVSSCDRGVGSYARYEGGNYLTSYGPWSENYGYGVFSAWKALIYVYGFGILEAKDEALDPSNPLVVNPPTVFSDDFFLRGDLVVPAGQTFVVNSMASVTVDTAVGGSTQDGPEMGHYANRPEIVVTGTMEVETSRQIDPSFETGVSATISVETGGVCGVNTGGTITISEGQVLFVYEGGLLALETGGEIVVDNGGYLVVAGGFECAGELTLESGSTTIFTGTASIDLATDLTIPAGAMVMVNPGAVVTTAATDALGGGSDPNRVEVVCDGVLQCPGNSLNSVVFECANSGAGNWVGIMFGSAGTGASNFIFTEIRDAQTGLSVAGSAPVTVMNLTIEDCVTGVKVTDRSDVTLIGSTSGGEISNCDNGVELDGADINVTAMSIHDNDVGIHCTESSPVVRDCDIYANDIGVSTFDSGSLPDLGTGADHGDNDFSIPGGGQNEYHIRAVDPEDDIYAQYNWWGTTIAQQIQDKIAVIAGPPPGPNAVIFEPFNQSGGGSQAAPQWDGDDTTPTSPEATYLSQNHPNPFNPTTTIRFGLNDRAVVSLRIYNISGQLVRELVNAELGEGHYELMWDGTDLRGNRVTSGVYFYRLVTPSFTETKKLLLLK